MKWDKISNQKCPIILSNKNHITVTNDKKHKGYVRIFRNIFKKKNDAIKSILDNIFNKWKKEAFKDSFIRKTILVRISVSRDKILRNRNSNRLSKIKDIKGDRPKSVNGKSSNIKRIGNKEKNINVNNIMLKKINDINSPKKENENPIKQIYKNNNNPIINPKKLNERIKNNNNITSILNNNLNQKYIKKNNREYQKKIIKGMKNYILIKDLLKFNIYMNLIKTEINQLIII